MGSWNHGFQDRYRRLVGEEDAGSKVKRASDRVAPLLPLLRRQSLVDFLSHLRTPVVELLDDRISIAREILPPGVELPVPVGGVLIKLPLLFDRQVQPLPDGWIVKRRESLVLPEEPVVAVTAGGVREDVVQSVRIPC